MNMKTSFMKIILVAMVSFITTLSNAQTFRCTSIEFSDDVSTSKQQKIKVQILGSKLECEIFDSDIKVTASYNNDGELKKDIAVFVKNNNISWKDIYEYKIKNDLGAIEFEKTLGFITRAKMTHYYRDKFEYTATFERELF